MSPPTGPRIDVGRTLSPQTTVYTNLDEDRLIIRTDTLWRYLKNRQDSLDSQRRWYVPLTIFATMLAALPAVGKMAFTEEETSLAKWEAVFIAGYILVGMGSFIWMLRVGWPAWRAWWRRENGPAEEIDQIIAELKKNAVVTYGGRNPQEPNPGSALMALTSRQIDELSSSTRKRDSR